MALRDEVITGLAPSNSAVSCYSMGLGLRGRAVSETTEDIRALIAAAPSMAGPGFFILVRAGELLRWLLGNGYRGVRQAMLVSYGAYQEPLGAFMP